MPTFLRSLLFLVLAAAWACAAPLPKDPALDRPVTAAAEGSLSAVLPALAEGAGVALHVDEHIGHLPAGLCVRDVPLRDVLAALAASVPLDWEREAEGAFRLTVPASMPPPMANGKLLEALLMACPSEIRPAAVGEALQRSWPPPPVESLCAMLTRPLRDAIEDGDEIPFARLPAPARLLARGYVNELARFGLARTLSPSWNVPIERLALQVQRTAEGLQ